MVIHVFYLLLDKAVDALAVRPVGELAHHAQAVGAFLPGEQLLDGHSDALAPPGLPVDADHLLAQTDPGQQQGAVPVLTPASLQGASQQRGGGFG